MGGFNQKSRDEMRWDGELSAKTIKSEDGISVTAVITTATLTHTLIFRNGILVSYNESGG